MSKIIQDNPQKRSAKIVNILVSVALVLAVILCFLVVTQVLTDGYVTVFGHSLFRVVTGSMEPEIPVGAILVAKEVEITELRIGDIICFFSLESGRFGQIITHRVVNILTTEDGMLLLQTKGDANLVTDIQYVTEQNLIGKAVFYTGKGNAAAGVLSFLTSGMGFMTCLALPAMLIAGMIMQESVKNMKYELHLAMERLEHGSDVDPDCPYQFFTKEEYDQMYDSIRQELMEEMGLLPKEAPPSEGLTAEEIEEMTNRIRAELLEELSHSENQQ